MAVTGIIAEYNPLHRGHLAQLRRVKEERPGEVVVVMSGSFVQRGEPALADKYRRCAMALQAGADLVLELPPAYATGSAEVFARGGVGILNACGFVEEVVFGASCTDTGRLEELAVKTEDPGLKPALEEALGAGLSYPAALERALEAADPAGAALLRDPNNLLGVEYIRAIRAQGAAITPRALPRLGEAHGSHALPTGGYASGSAIRKALQEGNKEAEAFLAPGVAEKLDYCIFPDDISPALSAVLLALSRRGREAFTAFADVSGDMAGRLLRQSPYAGTFSELVGRMGSGRYTDARIRRALIHVLLGIGPADQAELPRSLKILGLRKDSDAAARLKACAALPVITKTADAPPELAEVYAYAQRVYNQAVYFKTGLTLPEDYEQSPIVI